MLHGLPQVGAHMRRCEQDEGKRPRPRPDDSGTGKRREQALPRIGHPVAHHDQYQSGKGHYGKEAFVALLPEAAHPRGTKTRHGRQQMHAEKKNKATYEYRHRLLPKARDWRDSSKIGYSPEATM